MAQEGLDKHQLAGLDERQRGFSRPIEFERTGETFRAVLRYETVRVMTDSHPTQQVALLTLIQTLQSQGYRQLRTQMSFRNGVYLGSQELWIEYPDLQEEPKADGFLTKLAGWFRRPSAHDERS
jgi:hypothetical protein